jgi:hypothetical protein
VQTVRDADGRELLRRKRSADASLVYDPETGTEQYVPNDRLEPVETPPLVAAARAVPGPLRRLLLAVHDERSIGLLLDIGARGGVAVRDLLAAYDLCESDLHGMLAEFRAAGLVAETETDAGRGYELTDAGRSAADALRTAPERE